MEKSSRERELTEHFDDVRHLQIQSYSEHPEVRDAADVLVTAFYEGKVRVRDKAKYTRDARKLIASLWLHEDVLFRFTTKKAYFEMGAQGKRKQVWLTKRVLSLFNLAHQLGWIVLHKKGISPQIAKVKGKSFSSIYRTTETFYQLLSSVKQEDISPDLEVLRVELKDADGLLRPLPNNYLTSADYPEVVGILEQHYEQLAKTKLLLKTGEPVPLPHLYFIRKFRPNMTQGGRIYAQFQNYPKQERLGITMNDYPVASLDISQLHPQLLLRFLHKRDAEDLGLLAQVRGDDIYTMPDYPHLPRLVHKKLINTMINCKTERAAVSSLMTARYWQSDMSGEWQCKTYKGAQKREGNAVFDGSPKKAAQAYMESFKQHHPLLAPALCTGVGSNLQTADGRMMLLVMHYFSNVELPVIPIHDEVIVPKTKATMEFAQIALRDAFREAYGEEGSFGSIYAKWSFGDGTKEKQVEIKLGD